MYDRDKVIRGLEACQVEEDGHTTLCKANGCPYNVSSTHCMTNLHKDALALLKEQEPKMVVQTTSTIRCPGCGKQITNRGSIHKEIKYCWKCGQAVKWND